MIEQENAPPPLMVIAAIKAIIKESREKRERDAKNNRERPQCFLQERETLFPEEEEE